MTQTLLHHLLDVEKADPYPLNIKFFVNRSGIIKIHLIQLLQELTQCLQIIQYTVNVPMVTEMIDIVYV